MLLSLSIRNFTLIESLDLRLGAGLNIITGETGAGKSIVIDAFLGLLGERISGDDVRHGAQKAILEGIFSISGNSAVRTFLQEHDFDVPTNEIIVRREISAKGTSRGFINDTPATIGTMKSLGDYLVDFHGQHDHQSLLKPELHLNLLDSVGGLGGIVDEYKRILAEQRTAISTLHDLTQREKALKEQADYKRFQLQEILEVSPQEQEEEQLKSELSLIEHSEFLHEHTEELYKVLYEDDKSIRDELIRVRNILDKLSAIDQTFDAFRSECQSCIVIVEEMAKSAQRYNAGIEFRPDRLEEIRERLTTLARLRKKYGSIPDALARMKELQHELSLAENFDEEIKRLKSEIKRLREAAGKIALKLSEKRSKTALEIEQSIVAMLEKLGIPKATFIVNIRQNVLAEKAGEKLCALADGILYEAFPAGIDKVEFYISTNPGAEPKPLSRTASGGEISRVMLALKTILAQSDRLPMLVFDEIDTGISGRIAQRVGVAMKNLSKFHQLIAITHQPQLAALADAHIVVEKKEIQSATFINARVLSSDEHIREVARLLSGERVTDASLESARELMNISLD